MATDALRPHTGRRRNEAARQAILDAAAQVLTSGADPAAATIDSLAAAAGVGKQTIYRWWPSKGAVLLEAMTAQAADTAPLPDTGDLRGDLEAFFVATFRGVSAVGHAGALRAVMIEAQRDPHTATLLRDFTAARRAVLREIVTRAGAGGELADRADVDLVVDQGFGLLWYRLLVGHAALDRAAALAIAAGLARQASNGPSPPTPG